MPRTLEETLAWQDDAACAGMPLNAFFPMSGVVPEVAQRACSRCRVRSACADYGRGEIGVWGGTYRHRPEPSFARVPVSEALQPAGKEPYRSQGTAHTTTTPPQEAPDMTAKTTTAKTAPQAATTAEPTVTPDAPADDTRTKSTVTKDGSATCPSCKKELPVTKYPTARTAEGTYERDLAECRSCRDARRAQRKAEREAAKATAA